MSRRRFLQMGMVAGAAVLSLSSQARKTPSRRRQIPQHYLKRCHWSFSSIPFRQQTCPVPGYIARPFYRWGDTVSIKRSNLPEFKDSDNTTDERAAQASMP